MKNIALKPKLENYSEKIDEEKTVLCVSFNFSEMILWFKMFYKYSGNKAG